MSPKTRSSISPLTVFDFIDRKTIFLWTKFSVISSFHKHIAHYVKHLIVRKILQYPLVFLGTSPYKAPAVYSLMNHIDLKWGSIIQWEE